MDFQRGWRQRADELSETTKLFTLLGTYIHQHHGSRYYGKAMNITRRLTGAYDAALAECDLLLMPTTPLKAQPMPGPGAPREEVVGRALEMITNRAPFDITRHPAMAIPCGMADGLPVSVMLMAKHRLVRSWFSVNMRVPRLQEDSRYGTRTETTFDRALSLGRRAPSSAVTAYR